MFDSTKDTDMYTRNLVSRREKKGSVEIESDHHDEDFIRGVEPSVELLDDAAKTKKKRNDH